MPSLRVHQVRAPHPLATEAETNLAFAAVSYGPCASRRGCTDAAIGKSRLCGRHLDALLARLEA